MKKIPGLPTELQDLDWKEYQGDRMIAYNPAGFHVIVPKNMQKPKELFCPVCECVMSMADDLTSYDSKGACQHCVDSHYYQNSKNWESGWRPVVSSCDHKRTILVG